MNATEPRRATIIAVATFAVDPWTPTRPDHPRTTCAWTFGSEARKATASIVEKLGEEWTWDAFSPQGFPIQGGKASSEEAAREAAEGALAAFAAGATRASDARYDTIDKLLHRLRNATTRMGDETPEQIEQLDARARAHTVDLQKLGVEL